MGWIRLHSGKIKNEEGYWLQPPKGIGGSEIKASASNAGDPGLIPGFNPWVGKIPWRKKMATTLVGQRSLAGYSPWD